MVRKRNPWTWARAKRSRPKTPAPKTGWVISELAELTQIPVRRLRYYVERGIIRPLEFRGTATRYQRRELLRLLAMPHLRAGATRKIADLKRAFDRLGDVELEQLVLGQPLSPAARTALGIESPGAPVASTPSTASAATMSPAWPWDAPAEGTKPSAQSQAGGASAERWYRILLLPGLELMMSDSASPAVRNAARRICEEYVGR